jgi:DNA-directed RNA polymerase specialized sigma24 family protein
VRRRATHDLAPLLAQHHPAVLRYAARLAGVEGAASLAQAVLRRAWRRRRRCAGGAEDVLPWLLALVAEQTPSAPDPGDLRQRAQGRLPTASLPGDLALELALAALPEPVGAAVDLCWFADVDAITTARFLDVDVDDVEQVLAGLPAAVLRDLPEYAARWRAGLDLPRAVASEAAAPSPSTTTAWAGVAGVALLVGTVAFLGLRTDLLDPTSPGPDDRGPTAATPVVRPVAGPCRDRLHVGEVRADRTMGVRRLVVVLRLGGGRPCTVRGFSSVVPQHRGERIDVVVAHRPDDATFRGLDDVVVRVGQPAVVILEWSTGHVCPPVVNDRLLLTPPGASRALSLPGFGTTHCLPGGRDATLDVFPVRATAIPYPEHQLLRAGRR